MVEGSKMNTMIKSLRKRHLQVWIAMAMLMPLGIISAWLVIPDVMPVKILPEKTRELLPVIKDSEIKSDYCVYIRTNGENERWQLEWINVRPLKVPSAVIYRTRNNNTGINGAQIVGRIETRGSYVFELPGEVPANSQLQFIVYDFIHDKVIDHLKFKISK
jgi:hypothetical protein